MRQLGEQELGLWSGYRYREWTKQRMDRGTDKNKEEEKRLKIRDQIQKENKRRGKHAEEEQQKRRGGRHKKTQTHR